MTELQIDDLRREAAQVASRAGRDAVPPQGRYWADRQPQRAARSGREVDPP
jgi:hypothetical protein